MDCRGSGRARLVARDRCGRGRLGRWPGRERARLARDRRRHDRPRERRPGAPASDRHAGAGHRRVLLAGGRARAAPAASRRRVRRARGRPAARSRRRVRAAAPLRATRRCQRQPRARAPRGGDGLVLPGRARPLCGPAAQRRTLGAQRPPRHLGRMPATPSGTRSARRRRGPAPAGKAGTTPGRGIAGSCDPSYPTVCIPPPPPDLDCGDIPHKRFQCSPAGPARLRRRGRRSRLREADD